LRPAIEIFFGLFFTFPSAGLLATQNVKVSLRHFTLRVSFSPENPNTTYILASVLVVLVE
jgi:hypothetical protein